MLSRLGLLYIIRGKVYLEKWMEEWVGNEILAHHVWSTTSLGPPPHLLGSDFVL